MRALEVFQFAISKERCVCVGGGGGSKISFLALQGVRGGVCVHVKFYRLN